MTKCFAPTHQLIRFYRSYRGLSQESFAEKAGLSYRHFQDIEGGKVNISVETLRRIADCLDLHLTYLFEQSALIDFDVEPPKDPQAILYKHISGPSLANFYRSYGVDNLLAFFEKLYSDSAEYEQLWKETSLMMGHGTKTHNLKANPSLIKNALGDAAGRKHVEVDEKVRTPFNRGLIALHRSKLPCVCGLYEFMNLSTNEVVPCFTLSLINRDGSGQYTTTFPIEELLCIERYQQEFRKLYQAVMGDSGQKA